MSCRRLGMIAVLAVCVMGLMGYATMAQTAAKMPTAAPKEITVEVRGLNVIGEGYGKDENGMAELNVPNGQSGTALTLLIMSPSGGLIAFDKDASKLSAFADNKGTSLLEKRRFGQSGFGGFPKISKDGKACMLEIQGGALPSKDATGLVASGTLVFKTGTTKKEYTQKDVPLTIGSKITVGAMSFEITKIGKPDWGDEPLEIELKTKQDISTMAGIKFLDAAGKEIESDLSSWGNMGFGGMMTYKRSYKLGKMVNKATIVVSVWTDMKTQTVPLNVNTSIGF